MSKAYALSPVPTGGHTVAMPSPISPQMAALAAAKDEVAAHRSQTAAAADALTPQRSENSHPPANSFSSVTTTGSGGSGAASIGSPTRSRSPSLDSAMESLNERAASMPAFRLSRGGDRDDDDDGACARVCAFACVRAYVCGRGVGGGGECPLLFIGKYISHVYWKEYGLIFGTNFLSQHFEC